MATTARAHATVIQSGKTIKKSSRENEILKELEGFFDHHLSAKSSDELKQHELRSEEILKESRKESKKSLVSART
jgi:hypothetical protein